MDKTLRNAIIIGISIISISLIYFLIIKPQEEKKAYQECIGYYGGPVSLMSPQLKELIEHCAKTGVRVVNYKMTR